MKYRTSPLGEVLTVEDVNSHLTIQGCAYTSVGMVRGNNEDNVQLWALDNAFLGLVADGMGGAAGGEEASRLAVQTIQEDFVDRTPDDSSLNDLSEDELSNKLRAVLGLANRIVLDKAMQQQELQGMGTTATMVMIRGSEAVFAHIGDSRAYIVDNNAHQIQQVTSDHSFVEALVASGHLTQEQAEVHPLRNVLYRALGQKDEAENDIDIYQRRLKPGDRVILCSDGLPRHLKDKDIAEIALASNASDEIAHRLVDLTNARGGEDNVSVLVLVVSE